MVRHAILGYNTDYASNEMFVTKPKSQATTDSHSLVKSLQQTLILMTVVIACPDNFRQFVKHRKVDDPPSAATVSCPMTIHC